MRLRDWLKAGFWLTVLAVMVVTAPLRAPDYRGSIDVPTPPPITPDDRDWLAIATCLEVVLLAVVIGAIIIRFH